MAATSNDPKEAATPAGRDRDQPSNARRKPGMRDCGGRPVWGDRRRRPRAAAPPSGRRRLSSPVLPSLLLLLLLPAATDAGLSIGGVTNTDACYAALRAAREGGVVTKEGYVALVDDLSGGAFEAFQPDPSGSGEWGYYPATDFEDLPPAIKEEFYTHACGGPYVTCDEAYLYTDGLGGGKSDVVLTAQQEIYLFQVCVGVEGAIKEARPKTSRPTRRPTPPPVPIVETVSTPEQTYGPTEPPVPTPPPTNQPTSPLVERFTGDLPLQLRYHATVSTELWEELQVEASDAWAHLLGAMNDWSFIMTANYTRRNAASNAPKFLRRRTRLDEGRRGLIVRPVPPRYATREVMNVATVDCGSGNVTFPNASGTNLARCVRVTTNLTIKFTNEPVGSEETALSFLEDEFYKDCVDGTFHNMIKPEDTQRSIRAIYPPPAVEAVPTAPSPTAPTITTPRPPTTATRPTPKSPPPPPPSSTTELVSTPQPDNIINLETSDNNSKATEKNDNEGGPNVAGIASGVTISVVVTALLAFFVVRRRRSGGGKSTQSLSSHESGYKKTREFDPANDLEAGRAGAGSPHGSDYSSSRDEFSSGDSDSSDGSMQSYSGSESSSSGSDSSGYTSRSSYTSKSQSSRSASDHGGSFGVIGPAGDRVGAEESSHGMARHDPYEGSGTAVARVDALGRGKDDLGRLVGSSGTHSHYDDGRGGGASDESNATYSQGSSSASYRTGSAAEEDPSDRVSPPTPEGSDKRKGSTTTGDDDSSAGSSGWDSSDGDSSVDSGSVETYDLNDLGSSVTPSQSGTAGSSSDSESMGTPEHKGGYANMMNPAVNPVVQRSVTMLPIEEASTEDETMVSDDSESTGALRQSLPGSEIREAIEKGDWAAVGATAAILANSGSESEDNGTKDGSMPSSRAGSGGGSIMSDLMSTTEDEDEVRAAEIDALVENGNWDGVVAVAARYADEADEADSQLGDNPSSKVGSSQQTSSRSNNSTSISTPTMSGSSASMGSVSVETADASSIYSNTTRDSMSASATSYSDDPSTSTVSGTTDSPQDTMTGTNPDSGTQSSSITSSYVSASGVTSSMVSAVSSVDIQEKRQMNAYRAEVEALVRRVVPDEIDNVDDIMVQFSGREEELIETLRSMQEKSIAQRARAAVQRSAKQDLRDSSARRNGDESSEDLGHSMTSYTEGGETYTDGGDRSMTTDGHSTLRSSRGSGSYSSDGSHSGSIRDSLTRDYTEGEDDYSTSYTTRSDNDSRTSTNESTSVSSYTSGSGSGSGSYDRSGSYDGSDRSGSDPSILSELGGSLGVISVGKSSSGEDIVKASPGLGDAIDASDWRAVGEAAAHLRAGNGSHESSKVASVRSALTGVSADSKDELDGMIDRGDWGGIIDAASNMTGGHVRGGSSSDSDEGGMDSILD